MDKFSKKLSLGGWKETMQKTQQEFSTGLRSFTEKAKKEAKIANKKARKLMEVEDGGELRNEYILSVNLSAGHDLFKKFQNNWATMHEESIINVEKCDKVDATMNSFSRDYYKSKDLLEGFQNNLVALPEVLSKVEIAQSRIDSIAKQVKQIERAFLDYEDACDRLELEKQKNELKIKLSQLVETKHAEYTLKKSIVEGKNSQASKQAADKVTSPSKIIAGPTKTKAKVELEKRSSMERQKAYQDAFMEQMNQYIQHGEVEKPIAGSANSQSVSMDFEIGESDFSALSEFLGPEELSSFKKQSAKQKPENEKTTPQVNTNTTTTLAETAESYSEMSPEDILNRELAKGRDISSSTCDDVKKEENNEGNTEDSPVGSPEPQQSNQEIHPETESNKEDAREEKSDNSKPADSINKDNSVEDQDEVDNTDGGGPVVAEDIAPGGSDDEFYDADP
ncbi:dysbindin-like [Clytia hemisphaerica]|uniref:Uncharacterized protein n=1 Tax=Clytia hemisphaerica TaxID=252671 RepID=A0A7M5VCE1_9CNID